MNLRGGGASSTELLHGSAVKAKEQEEKEEEELLVRVVALVVVLLCFLFCQKNFGGLVGSFFRSLVGWLVGCAVVWCSLWQSISRVRKEVAPAQPSPATTNHPPPTTHPHTHTHETQQRTQKKQESRKVPSHPRTPRTHTRKEHNGNSTTALTPHNLPFSLL